MRVRHIAAASLGWVLWTAAEYVIHRCAFHSLPAPSSPSRARSITSRALRLVSSEHRAHHRDPLATSLPLRLVGHFGVALVSAAVPARLRHSEVWAGWIGFSAGYSIYETLHCRIHHQPSLANAVKVEHHRIHHEVAVRSNLGVTVDWWDRAFGTFIADEPNSQRV